MGYYVYILECRDKSLYIGSTNDLPKRVHAHNHAKSGAKYTKARRPVTLRYSESHDTFREARQREAELKKWKRDKKLNLIQQKSGARKVGRRQKEII